jgi:hypothetical protein
VKISISTPKKYEVETKIHSYFLLSLRASAPATPRVRLLPFRTPQSILSIRSPPLDLCSSSSIPLPTMHAAACPSRKPYRTPIHREVPLSIEPPRVAAIYAVDEGATSASASPSSPLPNAASLPSAHRLLRHLQPCTPPLFFHLCRHHPLEPHPRRQDPPPCVAHTCAVRRSCTHAVKGSAVRRQGICHSTELHPSSNLGKL